MTGWRSRRRERGAPHGTAIPPAATSAAAPPGTSPARAAAAPAPGAAAAPPATDAAAREASGGWGRRATGAACGALGLGMILLPAITGNGTSLLLAGTGLALVAGSLAGPFRHWRGTGALAAMTAVIACAAARPGTATWAVAGLLMLGYLLLLDAPPDMRGQALSRWLARQVPVAVSGAAASAAVLVLLAVPVPASAWLVVAGTAAAVAAAAIALPRRREPR